MGCLYIKLHITASASLGDGGVGDSYNGSTLLRAARGQREKRMKSRGSENAYEITWVGQGISSEIHTLARRTWHIMVRAMCHLHTHARQTTCPQVTLYVFGQVRQDR